MISLIGLSKSFKTSRGQRKILLKDVSLDIPTGTTLGLLGQNGAGKSTLLQMIGGTVKPDDGKVLTTGTISWPVGHSGSFHSDMTGAQNVRFIARIYGVDTDELCDFVNSFAGLGAHFTGHFRQVADALCSRGSTGSRLCGGLLDHGHGL